MLYLVFRFTDVETIKNLRLIDKYWNEWYSNNTKYLIELYLKREYIGFTTKELFQITEIVEVNPLESTDFSRNDVTLMSRGKTLNYPIINISNFPVHKSISIKPKTLFEQIIIRNRNFNLDNVVQIDGKFILLNDGSVYFDRTKISKFKYVTIKSLAATNSAKDICLGLTINGFIHVITNDENQISSLKEIVHINCAKGSSGNTLSIKVINRNGDLIGMNVHIGNTVLESAYF